MNGVFNFIGRGIERVDVRDLTDDVSAGSRGDEFRRAFDGGMQLL